MKETNTIVKAARKSGISEVELVAQQVEKSGSVRGAARDLGVNPNSIYYWLRLGNKKPVRKVTFG